VADRDRHRHQLHCSSLKLALYPFQLTTSLGCALIELSELDRTSIDVGVFGSSAVTSRSPSNG